MSRVIVIGGSDQGRQVIDAIVARGFHTVGRGARPDAARGVDVVGVAVVGSDEELALRAPDVGADGFVVAIGDNANARSCPRTGAGDRADLVPVTIVHPSAVLGSRPTLGPGSILLAGAVVGNGTHLGGGVLLGIRSSVDHDWSVGDFASLGPGATTGGNVRIGQATAVGVGATVIHGITIGDDTVVGAGAVVLDDVPDRVVAYGVPAPGGPEPGSRASATCDRGHGRDASPDSAGALISRSSRPARWQEARRPHRRTPSCPTARRIPRTASAARTPCPSEYGPAQPPDRRRRRLDHSTTTTPAVTVARPRRGDRRARATAARGARAERSRPTRSRRRRSRRRRRRGDEPADPAQPLSRREIASSAASRGGRRRRSSSEPRSNARRARSGSGAASASPSSSLLIPVAYRYVDYLNAPGSDSISVKTVEWFRDHGGNGFVNTIERWWYTNNPPPTGGQARPRSRCRTPSATTDAARARRAADVPADPAPPAADRPRATPAPVVEPNEGVWQPTGRLVGGPARGVHHVRAPRRGAHLVLHGV